MSAPIGNKYALGNTGGRPAAYETPEDLLKEAIGYFDYCNENNIKATITGITLFLGFSSRSSLDDYCNKSEEFAYIIKRAKLAVENSYELSGETIDIFALKNMGWKDTQVLKHDVTGFMNVDPLADDPADHSTSQTSKA
jgi:hypothetical protein